MAGQLTIHVLDTAQGRPAAAMEVTLWHISTEAKGIVFEERAIKLKSVILNAEGRTVEPLLTDEEMLAGTYELVFNVGAYFAQQAVRTSEPPFLSSVPVRFTIADASAKYHIPLLVSPWSYSTYRGG
jgi:5-hydroxyisourate hydrolase